MWTDLCEIGAVALIYPNSLCHKKGGRGKGEGGGRQNKNKPNVITKPGVNQQIKKIGKRHVKKEEEEEEGERRIKPKHSLLHAVAGR